MVTLGPARDVGLTAYDVDRLCRSGRWRRLSRATYLVNAVQVESACRRAQIRAAVWSLGPGAAAVLSSAAELHGIAGIRRTGQIHVSVPGVAARTRRPTDPATRRSSSTR